MNDYRKRLWLAEAPPGTWSSGPAVLYDFPDVQTTIGLYEGMGWTITGPYELEQSDE